MSAAYSPNAAGDVAVAPAAAVLQRLRQVPVVERDERRDAALQQRVDELAVEVQALRDSARRCRSG